MGLCLASLGIFLTFNKTPEPAAIVTQTVAKTPVNVENAITPAPVVETAVVAQPTAIVAAPSCTPDTSYVPAGAITPTQPGLEQVIDEPSTYAVYGNTSDQIMSEIAECTPVHSSGTNGIAGDFAASTANTISWTLNYIDNNDICSVASVDVTLHINQVFPSWQASAGSPVSLNSTWQTYLNGLEAYEQGHAQLDEAAASQVLSDLQNLPASSCDTIGQSANTVAEADTANNLTANTNYDLVNNYGLKENVTL
jgi:predicted secreted Zn-dependent protease